MLEASFLYKILWAIGILVAIKFGKQAYFGWIFDKHSRGFARQWEKLSLDERADFMFATHAETIRDANRGLDSFNRKPEGKHPGVELDYLVDRLQDALDVPDYTKYSDLDLTRDFFKNLHLWWRAMKQSGDFDLDGFRSDYEDLFRNFRELARSVKAEHLRGPSK